MPTDPFVDRIRTWPDPFVAGLAETMLSLQAGHPLSATAWDELMAHGVVDERRRLTDLGGRVRYHLEESRRQFTEADLCAELGRPPADGGSRSLLDVGCGAGQTLRHVDQSLAETRVGIDIDPIALAIGTRLGCRGERITLVRGTATRLPFRDGSFTHVVSRVTLNYVHQARALREMARVLRPGGSLILRVEGPGFDWTLIAAAPGLRAKISRCFDFLLGTALAVSGRQRPPGGRLRGGRCFATARGIVKVLRAAGCPVIRAAVTSRRLGLPVGFEIVARREPARSDDR